jgi:hypothetical protein
MLYLAFADIFFPPGGMMVPVLFSLSFHSFSSMSVPAAILQAGSCSPLICRLQAFSPFCAAS